MPERELAPGFVCETKPCGACRVPTWHPVKATVACICMQCTMIADGQKYPDGSDPADGLSHGEITYIGTRVMSLRRLDA